MVIKDDVLELEFLISFNLSNFSITSKLVKFNFIVFLIGKRLIKSDKNEKFGKETNPEMFFINDNLYILR